MMALSNLNTSLISTLATIFSCIFGSSIPFFVQAKDGIRDGHVTGVQTCALPIYFYRELTTRLGELGVETAIYPRPNELEDATPFAEDETHAAYDGEAANRCWRVLVQAERVFKIGRASCRERVRAAAGGEVGRRKR